MNRTRLGLEFLRIASLMTLPLLSGCGRSPNEASAAAPPKDDVQASTVRYVNVAQETVSDTIDLAAKIQADPTKVVRIFPPASGRVISISVKPGDRVRRGQILAVLVSSDVASARADFDKANIEAQRATRAMERQKLLFEHGAAAEKDYIDARAQSDTANSELARAKQRLNLLNVSLTADSDRISLTAPAEGVVLDVSAAPGEFSKSLESANPLITIADLDTIWVVGDLYEKDAAKVSRGKPVTITVQAYDGQKWDGKIDSISGALDPVTRTLKVRVALPNAHLNLKPEMFASIHVDVGSRQSFFVPAASIIREGDRTTVFAKTSGTPEQRTVTTGQTLNGKVEILNGLQAGQQVAAEGAELLKGSPAE